MSCTVHLIELLRALGTAMTAEHVDRLLELGVPAATTIMCGMARIQTDGRYYQPDDNGPEATILPCLDGEIVTDLLAFAPADPAKWWLRRGEAVFVGGDALNEVVMGEPVRVSRTPLAWLRAGAPPDGLVILDWATAQRELAHYIIAAEDVPHGRELRHRLSVPARHPRIFIPRAA